MYEWHNGNRAFEAVYSEVCKHKWTVQEWKHNGSEWKKTGFYIRFDTLEEARDFVNAELFGKTGK